MGKKSKGPKGPRGAAAYSARVAERGLSTVVADTRKKVSKKRRSYKRANTPVSEG